jgi:tetratricopeptide (TPR) repeat protein
MGNLALDQGRLDKAFSYLQEALALQRQVGDRWMIGNTLNNLGNVARSQGDHDRARALYDESLAIYRVLADKWALAYLFEDVGCLAALQGQSVRALQLAGVASALREQIGAPLSPIEQGKLEEALSLAREALDDEAQAQARSEGRALSLEEATEVALNLEGP